MEHKRVVLPITNDNAVIDNYEGSKGDDYQHPGPANRKQNKTKQNKKTQYSMQ
jgi:hypothetical protein